MKKLFLALFVVILVFTVSCTTSQNGNDETGEAPTLSGVDAIEIEQGEPFNALDGVTAVDQDGNDITDRIVVFGLESMGLSFGNAVNLGEFTLTYRVTDEDANATQVTRLVSVVEAEVDLPDELKGCGNPVIGDYVITWCDEFTGEGSNVNAYGLDLDKWYVQTGTGAAYGLTGWGNYEQQYYLEERATVEDGRLTIEARRENHSGMNYTSARIRTYSNFSQLYGRFEAKIRLPVGDGLWPAFWMMPEHDVYGGWAASGEIDIMEARGRLPYQSIGALHFGGSWPNNTHTAATYHFPSGQSIADWNVYALEWEEGELRWYVNDILFKTSNSWHTQGHDFPAPFDQEFHMLLNLAVGGSFDGGITPPDSLFNQPVLMEVEYVRVYEIVENGD